MKFVESFKGSYLEMATLWVQDQVQSEFFLGAIVRQGVTILQLQTLLVWEVLLLVLDLSFDVLNGVTRLCLKDDGHTSQDLHEDLLPQLPVIRAIPHGH